MTSLREPSIVVVEDSEEDFTTFRRALRKGGVETNLMRFSDGEMFLAALREGTALRPPNIVVLDLNLPALNGVEVLREIRDDPRLRSTPVVVLSTSSDPRDVQRCYELGIGGYILKEGDFSDFSVKIGRFAAYWLKAVHFP